MSNHVVMDEEGEGIVLMQNSWERTDRDYEYEEVCTTANSNFMIVRDAVHPNRN